MKPLPSIMIIIHHPALFPVCWPVWVVRGVPSPFRSYRYFFLPSVAMVAVPPHAARDVVFPVAYPCQDLSKVWTGSLLFLDLLHRWHGFLSGRGGIGA